MDSVIDSLGLGLGSEGFPEVKSRRGWHLIDADDVMTVTWRCMDSSPS